MRKLIIALGVFAIAAPVAVQAQPAPGSYPYVEDDDIVRRLPPPGQVEEMGERIGDAADAIMGVDIGPVADAIDPTRRYRPYREHTLGDLASRRDPYARERMRDSIDRTTYGLGVALQQLAIMTPMLARSIEEATRRVEDAMYRPGGRYYRDGRRYDRSDSYRDEYRR